jgi:hypothetical protein
MPKGYKAGGRKKGTPNKTTGEVRETLTNLIMETLTPDFFASLTPDKRADIAAKLLPFVIPKFGDIQPEPTGPEAPHITINWTPKPSDDETE